MLGRERLLIRTRAEFLFLLHDIECALREVACLLGSIHAAGTLFERITRVAHFNDDVFLQLFSVHLRLAVLEFRAVLVGLGDAIAQRHLELEAHLVLGRRVVQSVLMVAPPQAGGASRAPAE